MNPIPNRNLVDLTGKRFGRLMVVRYEKRIKKFWYWLCVCDCGNETVVSASNLKSNHTKSCGSYKEEKSREKKKTSKPHYASLRIKWDSMKARCLNQNSQDYHRYGGRGISICEEWMDFEKFYEWSIKSGFEEKLTIERKDVNGNYEPSNCEYTTRKEQARNRRNSKTVIFFGKEKLVCELAEETGIKYATLQARIKRGEKDELLIRPIEKGGRKSGKFI